MKLHLPVSLLTAFLLGMVSHVCGATYTNLTQSWSDEENKVIYNGKGYFAVESTANTSVDLTINLSSLLSYVNSNDYKSGGYMMLWEANAATYGMADNADVTLDNGTRTPWLSGYWAGEAWNSTTNKVDYSTFSQYAVDGDISLNLTNSSTGGVTVTTKNSSGDTVELYKAEGLRSSSNTTLSGYYVNLNYVTSVTLHTPSTLDTSTYLPPPDYSEPFVSQRTDGSTVGRVTFMGDSITHGVNDQSYRWQLFKTWTDNGIENEIVGPREGYYNTPGHTEDAGSSYGGAEFANVHLAQASGRTHNIISGSAAGSGVNYGGHSTQSTAADFDSNTWFCMMGTNDLLSDTPNDGPTVTQYSTQMQKVLGGAVNYDSASDSYKWTSGADWGTMGKIVSDVCKDGDTFYMLSITPWGNHVNHNRDMDHYAGQEFNRNLEAWTKAYSTATGQNVIYVDVTRGMVDVTSANRFMGYDAFFNNSGDRLHPNDQGSLLMAGNLAQAMGIGGRTAGLERMSDDGWSSTELGSISAGFSQLLAENAFTMQDGYTIDLSADFGNGALDGWSDSSSALSVSLGDGTNSGTLNVTEGYIMWGSEVLFCRDNSTLSSDGNLRVAWHNGNSSDNVQQGYYVWLGDMLIGQGLAATSGQGLNGILVTMGGASAQLHEMSWTNTAYAPITSGIFSAEHAYVTTQDAAAVSGAVLNSAYVTNNVDFSSATVVAPTDYHTLVTSKGSPAVLQVTSAEYWVGMTNCEEHNGDIAVKVSGKTTYTFFGAMNKDTGSSLSLVVADGADIGDGTYSNKTAAIAGSFGGGGAEKFDVYVEGGKVSGDIVGGAVHGSGTIDTVKLVISSGTVEGDVLGGSKTEGTVGQANIVVTGGTIKGGINAGGDAGTIGSTNVTISGGFVAGNITKGTATRTADAVASVTIVGNEADIRGSIQADKLTLMGVQNELLAEVKDIKVMELSAQSDVGLVMGDEGTLLRLKLGAGTTLSAWKSSDVTIAETINESTLTIQDLVVEKGAALNANLVFESTSSLVLEGSLAMGSTVELSSGMSLTLSDDLLRSLYGGNVVTLFTGVDALLLDGSSISAGSYLVADDIFTGLDTSYSYQLGYKMNGDVTLSTMVPEPTTTTLSLLALAGLALRRRRR